MKVWESRRWTRGVIYLVLTMLLLPLSLPMAYAAQPPAPAPKRGMSTKQKVVALAGAALLYYLYKKHQANRAKGVATGTVNNRQPQLYRSKNGGIYYRDANGRPVWLTVPQQAMRIPVTEVQRYAPDYRRYRGPAPAAPAGYRTESFSDFNGDLIPGPGRY